MSLPTLDLIREHLSELWPLLQDPSVTEVMVNPDLKVFVERGGRIEPVEVSRLTAKGLRSAITIIAHLRGDEVDDHSPSLDAGLEDGSRVAAMLQPVSVGGPTLTIRKFPQRFSLEDLVENGTLTADDANELQRVIHSRQHILISGGTGSGKTTLLNAIANTIDDRDRIGLIEETAEIAIDKPNLIHFVARREQPARGNDPGLPAVTIASLLRDMLRHRPDRIIVGEVRGAEAYRLLQALNTGHGGSLSTIHANSSEDALVRFADCVDEAGSGIPYDSIRRRVDRTFALVVHIERGLSGSRRVSGLFPVASEELHAVNSTLGRLAETGPRQSPRSLPL